MKTETRVDYRWRYPTNDEIEASTKRKLEGFQALKPGWHYGSGGPISLNTIEVAEELYDTLLLTGLTTTNAFPGAGGEILLTGYYKDHYVGFMIEPSGEISCTYERSGAEQASADDVSLSEAREWLIKDVARRLPEGAGAVGCNVPPKTNCSR
jgi:hypothetical protein